MEPHKPDLKTIFCEALELPAGPDRLAYLKRACGDDPALRARVDELLAPTTEPAASSARSPASRPSLPTPHRARVRPSPPADRRGRFAAPRDVPRRRHRPARRGPLPGRPAARRGTRHPHRPLQAPPGDRRGRHGHRLPRRAGQARPPHASRSRSSSPAWTPPRSSPASRPSARPWP